MSVPRLCNHHLGGLKLTRSSCSMLRMCVWPRKGREGSDGTLPLHVEVTNLSWGMHASLPPSLPRPSFSPSILMGTHLHILVHIFCWVRLQHFTHKLAQHFCSLVTILESLPSSVRLTRTKNCSRILEINYYLHFGFFCIVIIVVSLLFFIHCCLSLPNKSL